MTDGYVFHFALRWRAWVLGSATGIVQAVRDDRRLVELVPRLFEVDTVARLITTPGFSADGGWPKALLALAEEGVVDRLVLLDGCLARLQRGGTRDQCRGLLDLHDGLAPGLDELAARAGDYAALVPDCHSRVAATGQRELRRLDDAGRLDLDVLLDVSRAVFVRSEKKLGRAQLSWLDEVVRRAPEALAAVATAFGHDARDVQERAVKLVLKHGVDPVVRDELADAATALPADLRERLSGVLGEVEAEPEPEPVLAGVARAPMPPPLATPDEVAAAYARLLPGRWEQTRQIDVVEVERVLAGLVSFSFADRDALRAAFEPLVAKQPWLRPEQPDWSRLRPWYSPTETGEIVTTIRGVFGDPQGDIDSEIPDLPAHQHWRARLTEPINKLSLWMERLHEIALGVVYAPRPFLMATPTETSGLIDPHVLADRLEEADRQGFEPWSVDLLQARLRLPRHVDPAVVDRLDALGPPGVWVARWLDDGGSGDARTTRVEEQVPVRRYMPQPSYEPRTRVEVEFSRPEQDIGSVVLGGEHWRGCWPSVLPAYRDAIAAHLVPVLEGGARRMGPLLPLLAEAHGPCGDGMSTALAFGLGAGERDDRAYVVDALITLAGRGELDGPGLGAAIAHLVSHQELVLSRVVAGAGRCRSRWRGRAGGRDRGCRAARAAARRRRQPQGGPGRPARARCRHLPAGRAGPRPRRGGGASGFQPVRQGGPQAARAHEGTRWRWRTPVISCQATANPRRRRLPRRRPARPRGAQPGCL
ncbi:DUF6493 family protein [Saccharopolyspora erythraea]|uniref:DUF6493 family protein n=1 Tax=Saccharopolyspora erythraea TaxID=1836 RepID=UPI001EE6394E|nr:DUF6493 family protein [Saccharopolyspora erythraea]